MVDYRGDSWWRDAPSNIWGDVTRPAKPIKSTIVFGRKPRKKNRAEDPKGASLVAPISHHGIDHEPVRRDIMGLPGLPILGQIEPTKLVHKQNRFVIWTLLLRSVNSLSRLRGTIWP